MNNNEQIRSEITVLLTEYKEGDKDVYDKLFNMVYGQLKKVAHNIKFHNSDQQTLNTTALVHEAYIKLINTEKISWKSRQHFYSLAAKAIRQILIDAARKKQARKRNPENQELSSEVSSEIPYDVEALELALQKMEKKYETVSKIIEYRFFIGLTIKETAELLQISPATVKRNWAMGKMWLYREIRNLDDSQHQILLD